MVLLLQDFFFTLELDLNPQSTTPNPSPQDFTKHSRLKQKVLLCYWEVRNLQVLTMIKMPQTKPKIRICQVNQLNQMQLLQLVMPAKYNLVTKPEQKPPLEVSQRLAKEIPYVTLS